MALGSALKNPLVYVICSYALLGLFVWDYATSYVEFFPTVVALTNSSSFTLLSANGVLATVVLLWLVARKTFFGVLFPPEDQMIRQATPMLVVECVIVPLYFSRPLFGFFAVVNLFTLVWYLLHKVAEERINTVVTLLGRRHRANLSIRLGIFLYIATQVNLLVLYTAWGMSKSGKEETAIMCYHVMLFFALMFLSVIRSSVRFTHLLVYGDDNRSTLAFCGETVARVVEDMVNVVFFLYVSVVSTIPFPMIRIFVASIFDLYEATLQVCSYTMLRYLPDATAQDLERDTRCTICYENMELGYQSKRLACGHCYHDRCLQRWFEAHRTCPYCRADLFKHKLSSRFFRGGARQAQAAQDAPQQQQQQPQRQGIPADVAAARRELEQAFQQIVPAVMQGGQQQALPGLPHPPGVEAQRQLTPSSSGPHTVYVPLPVADLEVPEEDVQREFARYQAQMAREQVAGTTSSGEAVGASALALKAPAAATFSAPTTSTITAATSARAPAGDAEGANKTRLSPLSHTVTNADGGNAAVVYSSVSPMQAMRIRGALRTSLREAAYARFQDSIRKAQEELDESLRRAQQL